VSDEDQAEDQPELRIPDSRELGDPFRHPRVEAKLRALSQELARYRMRKTAAEQEAQRLRVENAALAAEAAHAKSSFAELNEIFNDLVALGRVQEPHPMSETIQSQLEAARALYQSISSAPRRR
jgi:hypothetical protein